MTPTPFVPATALALLLACPLVGLAQSPADPAAPPESIAAISDPPPHLIRIEGAGVQVLRDGQPATAVAGEPVLFGDRLESGPAYAQVLWGDGSRIAVDRGARLEALAPDLLALTAGRALVTRPASAAAGLRVDTPAASLVLTAGGEYRIELEDTQTRVGVVRGRVEVQTGMGDQVVEPGQQLTLRDGLAPGAPVRYNAAGYDSFVQWAMQPAAAPPTGAPLDTFADPRFEAYSDVFNQYGSWATDPRAGAVWYPNVGVAWRPYADGYWQAYGPQDAWLWVARDPWGWPTHHFGRWDADPRGRWFWVPGRQWAPAWVSWSVGPGYVGWTPLGAQDRPVRPWGDFAPRAGVYPGGTLDPARAWTVIPAERFGQRDRLGAYAVDPRMIENISAFVTQRVGPPVRAAGPRGGVYGGVGPGGYMNGPSPYGYPGGTAVYGPGGYYGGVRPRTGDDTTRELRGGIGPTRVGPASPGYGGPTPPPEDPYERAQRAVAPRGRPRTETPPAAPPAAETPSSPRQRTPPAPPPATPSADAPAAAPPPAAPPADSAPPPRASGATNGRRAVPRP
ncbi:hypothetical protein TBR22_A33950 [Luteitalea sp. TBR-22]|uniref:DUF6600 domain-containing protein n=1 Tax=Luteitalea sp. TBR-22 TaxID=2802971 RepID=UPI001AF0BF3C|nr:DUF6600 domain-containing protein [Luteitalea sp. TBR-22]BCS34166.1 hypothetical protein TBR22_A33950 [Luteitalea sp. TBR-22]